MSYQRIIIILTRIEYKYIFPGYSILTMGIYESTYTCIIINYTKSSLPKVFYDLVSTCRLVVLKLKEIQFPYNRSTVLLPGIKLSTINITKMLFCKHRVNINHPCGVKIVTQHLL